MGLKDKNLPHKDNNAPGGIEHRKYIRLNVVFPVEFQFIDPETSGSISEIKQGFTRNVGKGGICLEVNNLEEGLEQVLREGRAKIDLRLHIPLSIPETKAIARIAWHEKIKSGYPNKYLIGLSFLQIDQKDRARIYFHARRIILTPAVSAVIFFCLISGTAYFYSADLKLKHENMNLVKELTQLSSKKSELEKKIIDSNQERKDIEDQIGLNKASIEKYKARVNDLEKVATDANTKDKLIAYLKEDKEKTKSVIKHVLSQRAKFNRKVETLDKENIYLKTRVNKLSNQRASAEDSLKDLLSSFNPIEEKNISSMYQWIKNHQNKRTGLVTSYEGDKELEEWAFTYDQALACQAFTLMGDKAEAQMILDFYKNKAEKPEGAFTNAYDAQTGKVVEYSVHCGPNIWLGIAIAQYTKKFRDEGYMAVAEDLGKWLMALQKQDPESGLRGGPKFEWFSTEHNLDAYAFFGMLYKLTDDVAYLDAQAKTLNWLKKNAFNRPESRMNRGKGDATIATDTFAWAVASLGPVLLEELNMSPDQIMDFAETNCLVTTDFTKPGGENVKITGFDFGKYEHMARGGIVSTEWTSQMIVSFRIMADYYKDKKEFTRSDYYSQKADFYLSEMEKMVISSPSRIGQGQGCLPYATQEDADTGHGWRVAHGTRTGSTAGTAYTIFARYKYNPLALE